MNDYNESVDSESTEPAFYSLILSDLYADQKI